MIVQANTVIENDNATTIVAGSAESWLYLASYSDLMLVFGADSSAAALHYETYGKNEGRTITFDAWGYLASYGDLLVAFGNDTDAATQHYVTYGYYEGRYSVSSPVVSLSPAFPEVTEGNSGTKQMVFTVNLSVASASTVQVGYQTSNGFAIAGIDYLATSGTLTFAPGETEKIFSVPVIGDTVYEDDESFFVNLVNPTGAVLANNGSDSAIAEIINDDSDVMAVIMPFTPEAWRSGSNTLNLTMQFSSEIEYTGISLVGGGSLASSSSMQTIGGLTTLTIAITASPASSSGKINFGFEKANNTVFAIDIEEIRFNGTSYDKIVYTSIDGTDLSTYIDQNNDPSYNYNSWVSETLVNDTTGYDTSYDNIDDVLTLPNANIVRIDADDPVQAYLHIDEGDTFEFDYDTFVVNLEAGNRYRVSVTPDDPSMFNSNRIIWLYGPDGDREQLIMNTHESNAFVDGVLYSNIFESESDGDHYLSVALRFYGESADGPEPYAIELVGISI
jgi:hypothetical protein